MQSLTRFLIATAFFVEAQQDRILQSLADD